MNLSSLTVAVEVIAAAVIGFLVTFGLVLWYSHQWWGEGDTEGLDVIVYGLLAILGGIAVGLTAGVVTLVVLKRRTLLPPKL